MRRFLDALYRAAGWAAAASLLLIFTLVAIQVTARLADMLARLAGFGAFGFIIPSITEICGFLLAAASFLALSYTLTVGGHIRVNMLVERLPDGARRVTEALVGVLAAALAGYATVAVGRLAAKSFAFNDVSYGIVPVPLWIPQAAMTIGLGLLVIALLDVTWRNWRDRSFLASGSEA